MVEAGTTLANSGGLYVKTKIDSTPLPQPPPDILGPFRIMIKFSGLDCIKSRGSNLFTPRGFISAIIAFVIIVTLFIETFVIMSVKTKPFSIGWSESSIYGFMLIYASISAICLVQWTRSKFLIQFEDTLDRLRSMRLSTSQITDDYTKFHRKAALMALPIFLVVLSNSFYTSITQKHTKIDNSTFYSDSFVFFVAPLIDIFGCLAIVLTLIIYTSFNTALTREIQHFNKELTNSGRFQQLTLPNVLNNYSKRHSDILQFIRASNEHLSKLASFCPLFTLLALVNGIFIMTCFTSDLEIYDQLIVFGYTLMGFGITMIMFQSLCKLQQNIYETVEILMHDDVLQTCGDDQMHHTYRVMLDRCVHSQTQIAFLNFIPINSKSFNAVMFVIPILSQLMTLYYKLNHQID